MLRYLLTILHPYKIIVKRLFNTLFLFGQIRYPINMTKEEFRAKVKKGITERLADPVIKKRMDELFERKRLDKIKKAIA